MRRGSEGAGPQEMRCPFTVRRYRLSAAIHPVAFRTGAVRRKARRKSTTVLGRVRVEGYQIHEAGERSRRAPGGGRSRGERAGPACSPGEDSCDIVDWVPDAAVGSSPGGESGGTNEGASPKKAPVPTVCLRKSRRLGMTCRKQWSMRETNDNVKPPEQLFPDK